MNNSEFYGWPYEEKGETEEKQKRNVGERLII